MSARAEQVAAQARAALAGAQVPAARTVEAAADDARAARGQRRARTDRVRKTVDLAPSRFYSFDDLLGEWARFHGVAKVTSQDALDAAVRTILTDTVVHDRVRAMVGKVIDER